MKTESLKIIAEILMKSEDERADDLLNEVLDELSKNMHVAEFNFFVRRMIDEPCR